jgi:Na+-transporting methylmalonyl-CoA/oxaloacetate decarboxylase gamma subunit
MMKKFGVLFVMILLVSAIIWGFSGTIKQEGEPKKDKETEQKEIEKVTEQKYSEVKVIELSTYGKMETNPTAIVQHDGFIKAFKLNDVPVAKDLEVDSLNQGFICLKIDEETEEAVEIKKCE